MDNIQGNIVQQDANLISSKVSKFYFHDVIARFMNNFTDSIPC